jgi:hypothetical protein
MRNLTEGASSLRADESPIPPCFTTFFAVNMLADWLCVVKMYLKEYKIQCILGFRPKGITRFVLEYSF